MDYLLNDIKKLNQNVGFSGSINEKKLNEIKLNEISLMISDFKIFRSANYHLTHIDNCHICDFSCCQQEYIYTISSKYNLFSCIKSGLIHRCNCDDNCKFKFIDQNTYIICILSKRIIGKSIDNEIFRKQKSNFYDFGCEEKFDGIENDEHYEIFESQNFQTGSIINNEQSITKEKEEEKEKKEEKNLFNSLNFNFIFNDHNQLDELKIEENEKKRRITEFNKKILSNSVKRRRVRKKISEEIVFNLKIGNDDENEKTVIESIPDKPVIIKNKKISNKRKKQIRLLTKTPKRRKYNKTDKFFQKIQNDNIKDIENILYDILFNDSQRIRIEKKNQQN